MKSILLIRHAKSSWDSPTMKDFDRPLNERGLKDAPMMAQRMLDRKVKLDAIISSTAKRAFTTATFFAKAHQQKESDIKRIDKLYHAMPPVFEEVVAEISPAHNTVAIFSHNPGITEFANLLGVARIDNMPTCGILGVHFLCDDWQQAMQSEKRFWLFDYPKNI
ncbi:MAG TPA: histidine phosphatase family protein [Phnomibacter sp.]|nr:histidine phosphatase family protein [Phnomibacter sp.]